MRKYNFTGLEIPVLFNYYAYYPSEHVPSSSRDELALAIDAASSYNLKVAAGFGILYKSPKDEWKVKCSYENGTLYEYNWLDPTNPKARKHILNLTKEIVTKYDFDTLVLDYIRYDGINMPYTETARRLFEEYLGENITDWPGPFAPNGSRWREFIEWRRIPINTLVKEIHDLVKSTKSDIEIAAATLWWAGHPKWVLAVHGQDPVEWIEKRYIDRIKPMCYKPLNLIELGIKAYLDYAVAGTEGAVPITPYLSPTINGLLNETEFKKRVDLVRSLGVDGFTICSYGGPGDDPNNPNPLPDIRPYLDILEFPEPNTLGNISIQFLNLTSIKITWKTSQPATSKVEYNTTLFNVTYGTATPYPYEVTITYNDMNYHPGIVVIDALPTIIHEVVLKGLQRGTKYYFRVQSEGHIGVITSIVYEFEL
jgi:hypothetical protein